MKKIKLNPNHSLGCFVLGENIEKYLHFVHNVQELDYHTSYYFDDFDIDIWLDDSRKVNTIRCTKYCYWNEKNLIKMSFEQFLLECNVKPDRSEMLYVMISENRGQNQIVYDFDELGLMIWVWRDKIRTILISKYDKE